MHFLLPRRGSLRVKPARWRLCVELLGVLGGKPSVFASIVHPCWPPEAHTCPTLSLWPQESRDLQDTGSHHPRPGVATDQLCDLGKAAHSGPPFVVLGKEGIDTTGDLSQQTFNNTVYSTYIC